MNFAMTWEGFSTRFARTLGDAWAAHEDFPEWFASAFSGTVQGCNGNEAGGMIQAMHPASTAGEKSFSVRFIYNGTPENLIDLLFRFVQQTQRAVKRNEEALPSHRASARLSLSRDSL